MMRSLSNICEVKGLNIITADISKKKIFRYILSKVCTTQK